jgi:hypothetical protein
MADRPCEIGILEPRIRGSNDRGSSFGRNVAAAIECKDLKVVAFAATGKGWNV